VINKKHPETNSAFIALWYDQSQAPSGSSCSCKCHGERNMIWVTCNRCDSSHLPSPKQQLLGRGRWEFFRALFTVWTRPSFLNSPFLIY